MKRLFFYYLRYPHDIRMKYYGFGCGCQNSCGYPRMRIRMRSSDTPLVLNILAYSRPFKFLTDCFHFISMSLIMVSLSHLKCIKSLTNNFFIYRSFMQGDIVLAGFPLFVPRCNICQQPIFRQETVYKRKAKILLRTAVSTSGEHTSSLEGRLAR